MSNPLEQEIKILQAKCESLERIAYNTLNGDILMVELTRENLELKEKIRMLMAEREILAKKVNYVLDNFNIGLDDLFDENDKDRVDRLRRQETQR